MTINSFEINGAEINGSGIIATLDGALVTVQQEVRVLLEGELLAFEQTVELRETISGELVLVEQSVEGSIDGTLVVVSQTVRDSAQKTKLERRKYDCQVFLDGYQIPENQLTDRLTVEFNEDAAAVANLVLRPGAGVQDLSFYYGKTIKINLTKPSGSVTRVFTGVVDIVDFNVLENKTLLQCTDRRKELLEAIPSPQSKFGTGYDVSLIESLQGSNSEIISKLLPYAPFALDFDAYNQYHYTSWTPKATADISLSASQVYRREPSVDLVFRGRIINQVNIEYTYTHKRLHNAKVRRGVTANQDNWGDTLRTGKTMLSRETVNAVTSGGGWVLAGSVDFTPLPAPGWYGGRAWIGDAQVSQTTNTGATASGSAIRRTTARATYEANGSHCLRAEWDVYKRWTQDIQKRYVLTVTAPTSQSLFGAVDRDASYSVTDSYDATRWTDFPSATNNYNTGTGQTLNVGAAGSFDVKPDEPLSLSNLQAAIVKAQVSILNSHRDNTVGFEIPLLPEVQLYHTMEVTTSKIQAKGKVFKYIHTVDFKSSESFTEVEFKFYGLGDGGSTTPETPPSIDTTRLISYPGSEVYGSRYGVKPSTNVDNVAPGFYGNKYVSGVYTTIEPQLIIQYPQIAAGLTDGRQYSGSASYNLEIPTNTLVITYDEVCG
jgi:hypothetical protein